MFHANAWGLPYAATAVGAKQVFCRRHLDPAALVDLLVGERVTIAAGVPTVWLGVADELAATGDGACPTSATSCAGARSRPARSSSATARLRHPDRAGVGHDRDVAARQSMALAPRSACATGTTSA